MLRNKTKDKAQEQKIPGVHDTVSRRDTMRNTNRMAQEWLLQNGYDYIWLKPHMDGRKNRHKETYLTTRGRFYQTDLYNLFDGICFDKTGRTVFLQLSTNKFHPVLRYEKFFSDKFDTYCLMLAAFKAGRTWEIRTKRILPPMRFENAEPVHKALGNN